MSTYTTEQLKELLPDFEAQVKRDLNKKEIENDWLASRRGKLTASSMYKMFTAKLATANNATSEGYLYEKVAEMFGAYSPQVCAKPLAWGNDHELEAVETYIKVTGNAVENYGENQRFVEYGKRGGATPDGIILPDGCLQIKCPYEPRNHVKYLTFQTADDLRAQEYKYYVQVQYEMLVTSSNWCDFVSYDPRVKDERRKLKTLRIPRDNAFIELLKAVLINAESQLDAILKKIK